MFQCVLCSLYDFVEPVNIEKIKENTWGNVTVVEKISNTEKKNNKVRTNGEPRRVVGNENIKSASLSGVDESEFQTNSFRLLWIIDQ